MKRWLRLAWEGFRLGTDMTFAFAPRRIHLFDEPDLPDLPSDENDPGAGHRRDLEAVGGDMWKVIRAHPPGTL